MLSLVCLSHFKREFSILFTKIQDEIEIRINLTKDPFYFKEKSNNTDEISTTLGEQKY